MVRGKLPGHILVQYKRNEEKLRDPEKKSKQWYARHLMWKYAKERVPDLQSLSEKTDAGEFKLSQEVYGECLERTNKYINANIPLIVIEGICNQLDGSACRILYAGGVLELVPI